MDNEDLKNKDKQKGRKPLWRKWWLLAIYFSLAITVFILSWESEDIQEPGEDINNGLDITSQVEEEAEESVPDTESEKDLETEPEPEVPKEEFYLVDVEEGYNLFIRKSPGTKDKPDDDIIDRAPRGRVLKVIDKHDNKVEIDGFTWWEAYDSKGEQKGWVASEYLSDKKEIFAYDASDIFTGIGDDFSIQIKDKKITAKSKKEEIIELLGEPEDIKSYDEHFPIVMLEYPNIELGVMLEGVGVKEGCFSISTNSLEVTGPRNIRIGDSYESVIEKFPDEEKPKEIFEQSEDIHYERVLYGEAFHLSDYGRVNYNKDGEPIIIIYSRGPRTLIIDLENGKVSEIRLIGQLT